MKSIYINVIRTVICFSAIGCMISCNDSFMDRYPETSITEKVFFATPSDLETYTNGLYGNMVGSEYWDLGSDNTLYVEETTIYSMMRGEVTPKNADRWKDYWTPIRNINFMLNRTGQVQGDPAEINHYIGMARLFRAIRYYSLVKTYSDVPWYSKDLQTTDTELLYKPQDPRTLVVDSIMADLDFAVNNMLEGTSKTRVFRNAALAVQARIALEEASYRKYHSELGLTDSDKYYQTAIKACNDIMEPGTYSLSTVTQDGIPAYELLFCNLDLSSSPEIIFMEDYDKSLGRKHNAQACFDWTTGLSRDLMEDYLVIEDDKAIFFQQVDGYGKKSVLEVFENRDPRLSQTFMVPGFIRAGSLKAYIPKLGMGGYPQVKFSPRSYDQISWNESYTDLPVLRYAEILLIYAEAKAELGTLTQDDVDNTINLIRDRAGVPRASLSDWLANIDPVQNNRYSNVSSSQKGAVLEVRRERRIELACEGFRQGDLKRWSCYKLLEKAPEGAYISGIGYHDLTGDGKPNIAVVRTQEEADAIPDSDKEKYQLTVYILKGNTIELTEGDKGYIRLVSQHNKFKMEEPKYYYYPMNEQDLLVNPNLYQNEFWK